MPSNEMVRQATKPIWSPSYPLLCIYFYDWSACVIVFFFFVFLVILRAILAGDKWQRGICQNLSMLKANSILTTVHAFFFFFCLIVVVRTYEQTPLEWRPQAHCFGTDVQLTKSFHRTLALTGVLESPCKSFGPCFLSSCARVLELQCV